MLVPKRLYELHLMADIFRYAWPYIYSAYLGWVSAFRAVYAYYQTRLNAS